MIPKELASVPPDKSAEGASLHAEPAVRREWNAWKHTPTCLILNMACNDKAKLRILMRNIKCLMVRNTNITSSQSFQGSWLKINVRWQSTFTFSQLSCCARLCLSRQNLLREGLHVQANLIAQQTHTHTTLPRSEASSEGRKTIWSTSRMSCGSGVTENGGRVPGSDKEDWLNCWWARTRYSRRDKSNLWPTGKLALRQGLPSSWGKKKRCPWHLFFFLKASWKHL